MNASTKAKLARAMNGWKKVDGIECPWDRWHPCLYCGGISFKYEEGPGYYVKTCTKDGIGEVVNPKQFDEIYAELNGPAKGSTKGTREEDEDLYASPSIS